MFWILGLFVSAFIQVTCFLIASENLMHRMRKEFFKAILRQDIAWYDANHSGTLTSKLFDNLERVKEGTGDKVALAVQFLAQFFGGFIVGKLSLSRYPVMYDEIRYFSIRLRLEIDIDNAQPLPLYGYLRRFHCEGMRTINNQRT